MSDEEDNNTNEEEEEENEEGEEGEEENEEGEDEEGEDEEGEGEEGEDEEGEEEDDDKKKKKKKDASSTQKFETEKLVPQNEIKIDLSNGMPSNDTITMSNIPVEKPKSIFSILSEINSEMDALSSELNTTLSIIENKNIDRENEEMRELLNKANQITRDIDIMENIPKPIQVENKCVQSDNEEDYQSSPMSNKYVNSNENNNSPPQMRQFSYDTNNKRDFPYDPNKNKYYYSSLSSNNNIPTMNSNRFNYNTSRVKRMDELYQGRQFGNRMPVIYSQNEVNGSRSFGGERGNIDMNGSFRQNQMNANSQMINNNSGYPYSQMAPQRPFERYKPGNISQAMDILLDKQ